MFKKLIVGLMVVAISNGAVARDITVNFATGAPHYYTNTPDHVTPEQVVQRASRDFPGRAINSVEGFAKHEVQQGAQPAVAVQNEVGFWDSGWGTAIKWVAGAIVVVAIVKAIPVASVGCQYDWQLDKAGNRCGGRSASSRAGGR